MINYEDLVIAETWLESMADFNKLIARTQKDLTDYQQKADASPKRIEILNETIARMKFFASSTQNVIQAQKDQLSQSGSLQSKHTKLLEDYTILRGYALSKGLDLTLLPYLTTKDFRQ